jgi:hypothetical protein
VTVFCTAALNYASGGGPLVGSSVDVDIHDARTEPTVGWAVCGFELVEHTSAVVDWRDDSEVEAVHYGEIEALARELTGCDAALVSDHVTRTAADDKRPRDQTPVRLVHSDFAADYEDVVRYSYRDVKGRGARTLARTGMTSEKVEAARRVVMMQFWRNVGPPKMDLPMAFCDGRTVKPAETRPFLYTGYVAGGRSFNALAVVAPPRPDAHRWSTFPEMTDREVVAFRTYDTDLVAANTTWFTPHSAFRDPDVEPGRPPRTSVELRVMCLFSA